jgi:hypothetical protein
MTSHRGAHPEDDEQFAHSELPVLREAVADLSWLRTRGYGDASALKLVGDRYRLKRRQRNAVARSACSDAERAHRLVRRRSPAELAGGWIDIDGFNVVISAEGLLGGAYLFVGRDRAYRDVDPVQGTYRIVKETVPALRAVQAALQEQRVVGVTWWLDAHVSNVGRLRSRLAEVDSAALTWEIRIDENVDDRLRDSDRVVATSDSGILDRTESWCSIEELLIRQMAGSPTVRDLRASLPRDLST